MTARPLTLEDFGAFAGPVPVEMVDSDRLEAEKLESFDKGYAAGWEDAAAATEQAAAEGAAAGLARLQDLAFTYHEARAHVLRSVLPLLEALADRVVPQILRQTLGARLVEIVERAAIDAATAEVELLVAPGEGEEINAALDGRVNFPIVVREEDSLAPGLLHLRLDATEREFDFTGFENKLREAIAALDAELEETSHG